MTESISEGNIRALIDDLTVLNYRMNKVEEVSRRWIETQEQYNNTLQYLLNVAQDLNQKSGSLADVSNLVSTLSTLVPHGEEHDKLQKTFSIIGSLNRLLRDIHTLEKPAEELNKLTAWLVPQDFPQEIPDNHE